MGKILKSALFHLLRLILLFAKKHPSKNYTCRNRSLLGKGAKNDIAPDLVRVLPSRFRNDVFCVHRAPVKEIYFLKIVCITYARRTRDSTVISNHYSSPAFLSLAKENYVIPSRTISWKLNNFGSYPFHLSVKLSWMTFAKNLENNVNIAIK